MPPAPSSAAPRRRYTILRTLGRGGFGTVYLATQHGESGFSQRVALKVLNPMAQDGPAAAQREEFERRLRDEARMLGQLTHRSVVRALDLVWLDGAWTVVMEYAEGATLQDLARAKVAVPPGVAFHVAAEVAGALDACFNQPGADGRPMRLLHRDIKPGNVLVTTDGAVKVLDFGIARADFPDREAHTRSGGFGSGGYAPIEQYQGSVHATTDVYALGVTLWETLAGERFAETLLSARQHQRRVDECLAAVAAQVPGAAVDILRRMLAYDADERATIAEAATACKALARQLLQLDFEAYTREVVPGVMASRPAVGGGLAAGSVLEETGPSGALDGRRAAGASAAPPERGSSAVLWLGAGAGLIGVAGVLVVGLGAAAWWWFATPPHAVTTSTVPIDAPVATAASPSNEGGTSAAAVAAPAEPAASDAGGAAGPAGTDKVASAPPANPATPSPSGTRKASSPAASTTSPPSSTTPAESAVAPTVTTPPPQATRALGLAGDATSARLTGSDGRAWKLPGEVPEGNYRAWATFPGAEEVAAGPVVVSAGTSSLSCVAAFKRCTAR